MARFDRGARFVSLGSPGVLLAAVLAVSMVLYFLPPVKTQPLRDAWREALRPGHRILTAGGDWLRAARDKVRGAGSDHSGQSIQKIAELNDQLRRLQLELLIERSGRESGKNNQTGSDVALATYVTPSQPTPLLVSQSIPARVLGHQAKAFLIEREVLDVGKSESAQPNSLVVDADQSIDLTQVVDQGAAVGIEPNRLVLAGRRVWGRIADVGPHTSTVQRANDAGYRDLVQLASVLDGRLHFSARGMLVGTGEQLCKVELVETTQPITVGDLVFTADDGVLDSPLYYGRVTKLERKPGSAHWEIWVEPAVAVSKPPSQVSVLRMELNSARVP